MLKINHCLFLLSAAFFCSPVAGLDIAQAEEKNRVFEIRTYYANEGKLDALLARFRDHTVALFKKHGMTNVGYWVPTEFTCWLFQVARRGTKRLRRFWPTRLGKKFTRNRRRTAAW